LLLNLTGRSDDKMVEKKLLKGPEKKSKEHQKVQISSKKVNEISTKKVNVPKLSLDNIDNLKVNTGSNISKSFKVDKKKSQGAKPMP
jgi:hypothetical protein